METISKFWNVVVSVWEEGVLGIDIGRIIVALIIFFLFLLLRQLLAKFIVKRLQSLAKKTKFQFDDEIVEALKKPFAFIPVIIGFFLATEYLFYNGTLGIISAETTTALKSLTGKTESLESIADNVLRSMIVYFIFWSLVRLVQPLSFLFKQLEEVFSPTMV